MSTTHNNRTSTLVTATAATVSAICVISIPLLISFYKRKRKSEWTHVEDASVEPLHSMLLHFKSLNLDPQITVEEANKRRTVSYYEKAREAHTQELVLGVGSYTQLIKKRRDELKLIMRHATEGTKSHRTIVCMCDGTTAQLLEDARNLILSPLKYSHNLYTTGVWIPQVSIIPTHDMHVTVATPWWWHTIRENNLELSQALAARLRQTLLLKFHFAFQIELERIVLLGGKSLVALWRCVGHRSNEDGSIIYDRHGEIVDPFVTLREEIVRCFTTESPDARRQPLTYKHNKDSMEHNTTPTKLPPLPKPVPLERQHTIESKSPGLGSGDGFIHTTLARIPLDCMSMYDINLAKVHRLCREATATLSGHRMVVSKFRILETTGCGGESNPCVDPIFDETIEAPSRFTVEIDGAVRESENLHVPKTVESNQTIGAVRNFARPTTTMAELFVEEADEEQEETDEQQKQQEKEKEDNATTS